MGSARHIDLTVRECLKKKRSRPIFLSPEYTRRHTPPHNESEWTHKRSSVLRYSVCAKFRLRPRYERDLFPVCVCVLAKRPPILHPSSCVCVWERWCYGELTVTSNLLCPRRRNELQRRVRPGQPASQKKPVVYEHEGTLSFMLNDLRRILNRRSKVLFSHENLWLLLQSSHRYPRSDMWV